MTYWEKNPHRPACWKCFTVFLNYVTRIFPLALTTCTRYSNHHLERGLPKACVTSVGLSEISLVQSIKPSRYSSTCSWPMSAVHFKRIKLEDIAQYVEANYCLLTRVRPSLQCPLPVSSSSSSTSCGTGNTKNKQTNKQKTAHTHKKENPLYHVS